MIELRFRIKKCQLIFWCFFFSYFKACFVLFVIISYHFDVYTLKCIHSCFFLLLNLNFYIKMKYWYLKVQMENPSIGLYKMIKNTYWVIMKDWKSCGNSLVKCGKPYITVWWFKPHMQNTKYILYRYCYTCYTKPGDMSRYLHTCKIHVIQSRIFLAFYANTFSACNALRFLTQSIKTKL